MFSIATIITLVILLVFVCAMYRNERIWSTRNDLLNAARIAISEKDLERYDTIMESYHKYSYTEMLYKHLTKFSVKDFYPELNGMKI